ncbi:hypothetical protein GH714_031530 [Hevea brasiliensis]|uniref:Uncharacterized protein n=1 Tax=Hevea brasiliensis TaxID=3981 RepID=A0A6A6NDG2_HEVBR|nr:hypothetical protein GH714_031530 [Hevea brasiliensis]
MWDLLEVIAEKSLWSSPKLVLSNELSVVAVLTCGHVYHAECLETMTPEISKISVLIVDLHGEREIKMADLRDEHGNPIQLTDEHGNPVQLTDEFGNPVHITGVATSKPLTLGTTVVQTKSEDDGQGGRRKKKGLKEKIKEKLTGGKHKEEHGHTVSSTTTETTPGGREHHEHEKKSVMEKIKEKLPGHGHHSH